MIPRLKPTLGRAELMAALARASAQDVPRFEAAFARLMGQRHAVAFPYGRTGLMLLFEALGLYGREVITPAYTCVVVPHAIVHSGNTPAFCDCEPGGFNMDLDAAEALVTERTGAIVATSLFGYPVDCDRLDAFRARNPHVAVIEDCAHSFSATSRGRPVQREGAAAIFGLNISKIATSVFGGMVTTDDSALHARLLALRARQTRPPGLAKSLRRLLYLCAVYPAFTGPVYGAVNRLERSGLLDRFVRYFDDAVIDMPGDYLCGMTALEARVGAANLRRYEDLIGRRRAAAEIYFAALPGREGLVLPPRVPGATYSHFVLRVPDRAAWLSRGLSRGVQLGELIEYSIPEMRAYGALPPSAFPVAAEYARTTINLPVWGGAPLARRVVSRLFS